MSEYTQFFSETVRLEILLWSRLDQLQAANGAVSVAQLQALRAVQAGHGDARVHDVAAELQITVGAASKLVDRLERDGLASRSANPGDRRSMFVALTPEGAQTLDNGADSAADNLAGLLGPVLTEDRAAELAAALAEIYSSLCEGEVS